MQWHVIVFSRRHKRVGQDREMKQSIKGLPFSLKERGGVKFVFGDVKDKCDKICPAFNKHPVI